MAYHTDNINVLQKSNIIAMYGRDTELEKLKEFLGNDNIGFRWWAVTGPGGSGKSRLAYEFQKNPPMGWEVKLLKYSDYNNLQELADSLTQKTLLIADHVQEHALKIGVWLRELYDQQRSLPLRILLLEREASEIQGETSWTKLLFREVDQKYKLKNACFHNEFLELKPLDDTFLKNIIDNYALALQQRGLSIKQEESRAKQTIRQLEELAEAYPEEKVIPALYAKALFHLGAKQEET